MAGVDEGTEGATDGLSGFNVVPEAVSGPGIRSCLRVAMPGELCIKAWMAQMARICSSLGYRCRVRWFATVATVAVNGQQGPEDRRMEQTLKLDHSLSTEYTLGITPLSFRHIARYIWIASQSSPCLSPPDRDVKCLMYRVPLAGFEPGMHTPWLIRVSFGILEFLGLCESVQWEPRDVLHGAYSLISWSCTCEYSKNMYNCS